VNGQGREITQQVVDSAIDQLQVDEDGEQIRLFFPRFPPGYYTISFAGEHQPLEVQEGVPDSLEWSR
jgi:hypothetical protein